MDYTEPAVGVVPLRLRIAESLRTKMEIGVMEPGDSLPSVRELAKRWETSPGTVREALTILQREGRITTGRGKPARIREKPRRIELVEGWAAVQKQNVLAPEDLRKNIGALELTTGTAISDTEFNCSFTVVPATYEMAADLEIQQDAEVLERRYETLSKKNGHRLSFSLSWIPVELISSNPELMDEKKEPWPGGHMHQLYTVGIEVARMVRRVTAIAPSPGMEQRWGMEGAPMLVVRSKSIDTKHRVVEMSDAYYPADRTEIGFFEELPLFETMGKS